MSNPIDRAAQVYDLLALIVPAAIEEHEEILDGYVAIGDQKKAELELGELEDLQNVLAHQSKEINRKAAEIVLLTKMQAMITAHVAMHDSLMGYTK